MFGADVLKDYYVVYFNFEVRKYFVYRYMRNRKLTARQRWNLINNNEFEPIIISEGEAINIGQMSDIINNLNLPKQRCEMNMRFKC